jgi:DNA-nicking Smr family endonuclease
MGDFCDYLAIYYHYDEQITMSIGNKYKKVPVHILDLHGYTTREAQDFLNSFVIGREGQYIRVITGKGVYRNGPILQEYIKEYLYKKGISYTYAKISDGGEGALEFMIS